jgi:hypothetical protein
MVLKKNRFIMMMNQKIIRGGQKYQPPLVIAVPKQQLSPCASARARDFPLASVPCVACFTTATPSITDSWNPFSVFTIIYVTFFFLTAMLSEAIL